MKFWAAPVSADKNDQINAAQPRVVLAPNLSANAPEGIFPAKYDQKKAERITPIIAGSRASSFIIKGVATPILPRSTAFTNVPANSMPMTHQRYLFLFWYISIPFLFLRDPIMRISAIFSCSVPSVHLSASYEKTHLCSFIVRHDVRMSALKY